MNLLGLHTFGAKSVTELKFGERMGDAVYDCEIVVVNVDTEVVRTSYKWQINNMQLESWEIKLRRK
jgi:hypothetical protein